MTFLSPPIEKKINVLKNLSFLNVMCALYGLKSFFYIKLCNFTTEIKRKKNVFIISPLTPLGVKLDETI